MESQPIREEISYLGMDIKDWCNLEKSPLGLLINLIPSSQGLKAEAAKPKQCDSKNIHVPSSVSILTHRKSTQWYLVSEFVPGILYLVAYHLI